MPLDSHAEAGLRPGTILAPQVARVLAAAPEMRVAAGGLPLPARRAASCLAAVEADDLVLGIVAEGVFVVLHVLDAARPGAARLTHDAGIAVEAPCLHLRAQDELRAEAGRAVMEMREASLRSEVAAIAVGTLSVVGRLLRRVAERLETVATHLSTQATLRTTMIDGTDTLRAQDICMEADKTHTVQARTVVVAAREDVRVDGERVSVG